MKSISDVIERRTTAGGGGRHRGLSHGRRRSGVSFVTVIVLVFIALISFVSIWTETLTTDGLVGFITTATTATTATKSRVTTTTTTTTSNISGLTVNFTVSNNSFRASVIKLMEETKNNTHSQPVQRSQQRPQPVSSSQIPVFYNLFVKNVDDVPRVKKFVTDQLSYRQVDIHKPVFVNTIGVPIHIPNTTLLHHYEEGSELITLHSLWTYCQDHPTKKVIYAHSKGSYHAHANNDRLRTFLSKAVFSNECSHDTRLPDQCNVCSGRFSPLPHAHTPGNMWLARCSYVRQLQNPITFPAQLDMVYPEVTVVGDEAKKAAAANKRRNGRPYHCYGLGRYAAEHWVHSHPDANPCDVYVDPTYLWGYVGIPKSSSKKEDDYSVTKFNVSMAPRFPSLVKYHAITTSCPGMMGGLYNRFYEYVMLYNTTPSPDMDVVDSVGGGVDDDVDVVANGTSSITTTTTTTTSSSSLLIPPPSSWWGWRLVDYELPRTRILKLFMDYENRNRNQQQTTIQEDEDEEMGLPPATWEGWKTQRELESEGTR